MNRETEESTVAVSAQWMLESPEFSAFFSPCSHVILGKLLHVSLPLFSHVQNVDDENTYLEGVGEGEIH